MPEVKLTILEYCRNNCQFYLTEGICVYDELILGTLTFPLKCKGYLKYADIIKSLEFDRGALPRDQQLKENTASDDTVNMRPNAPQEHEPAVATCGSNSSTQSTDKTKPAVATCGSNTKPAVPQVAEDNPLKIKSIKLNELDYEIINGIRKGWHESKIGTKLKRHHSTIHQHIEKLIEAGFVVKPTRTHPGAKRYYLLTGKALPNFSNVNASQFASKEEPHLWYPEERSPDSGISDSKTVGLSPEKILLTTPFTGKHHCTFRSEIIVNTYTKDGQKVKNWNNYERYQHEKDGYMCISVNLSNDPHIIISPHLKTSGSVADQRKSYQKWTKVILSEFVHDYPGMIVSEPVLNGETTHNELNDFIGSHLGKKFPPGEYRSPQFRRDDSPTPKKVEVIGERLAENIEFVASPKFPEFAQKVVTSLEGTHESIEGLRQEMGMYVHQNQPKRSHKKKSQKHEATIYR